MNRLREIILTKQKEVAARKIETSKKTLQKSNFFVREGISIKEHIQKCQTAAIIAEHKRKSPSKGWFFPDSDAALIVDGYHQSGAVAASILTDKPFFGGELSDLKKSREACPKLPLLRKDFIIDSYQILESKAFGADAILLIAEILTLKQIKNFTGLAHELGLEVLLELHSLAASGNVFEQVDMLGINNRNLHSFEEKTNRSIEMVQEFGRDFCLVSESGIRSVKTLISLYESGFDAFLIGEYFMRCAQPAKKLSQVILEFNQKMNL